MRRATKEIEEFTKSKDESYSWTRSPKPREERVGDVADGQGHMLQESAI